MQFVIARLRKYHGLDFGYLGMRMQDVTPDMADALGRSSLHGAIISSVVPNAPASAAGVEVGDVVLTFNNQTFTDIRALGRMIATSTAGARVTMAVWRDGHEHTVAATIGGESARAHARGSFGDASATASRRPRTRRNSASIWRR